MNILRKWLTGLVIVMIVSINWLVLAPSVVYACSCMPPESPQIELERSTAVFAGEVTNIESDEGPVINSTDPVMVTFQVIEVWKGAPQNTITITTPRESASCGFNFEVGREYVVYAWDNGDGLSTNLCSRTAELSPDLEDLDALGPGTVPPQENNGTIALGFEPPAWLAYGLLALAAAGILVVIVIIFRNRRVR